MLYKAVGKNVTGLYFWSSPTPEKALECFQYGLKSPEDFADVSMVPLTLDDIENELKTKHEESMSMPAESWSDGMKPPADEVSGSVIYGADF